MSNLTTSNKGIALIQQFEGCKLTAYQDSVGVWTIGYGHTSGVSKGMTITQEQATAFLKIDLATAESAVNSYMSKYQFNQNQFDALVSFTFNCGSGNLKLLTASGTRSISEISNKITAYNKAGGKVLEGLVKRRAAEKTLFDAGYTSTDTNTYLVEGTVTGNSVNIRKGPGTKYSVIDRVNKGNTLTINLNESEASWYKCHNATTNIDGYISKSYVSI